MLWLDVEAEWDSRIDSTKISGFKSQGYRNLIKLLKLFITVSHIGADQREMLAVYFTLQHFCKHAIPHVYNHLSSVLIDTVNNRHNIIT